MMMVSVVNHSTDFLLEFLRVAMITLSASVLLLGRLARAELGILLRLEKNNSETP
jgi:hypothetical protein